LDASENILKNAKENFTEASLIRRKAIEENENIG
jgi:hypothetical protein